MVAVTTWAVVGGAFLAGGWLFDQFGDAAEQTGNAAAKVAAGGALAAAAYYVATRKGA